MSTRTETPSPASTSAPPARPRAASAPRRVRSIDGLRGVAVAAVVLYHLFPDTLVGGYLGVDVFFVISGFVITAGLLHVRATTGSLQPRRFWMRRAQRLLPALAAMLVAVTAAAAFAGPAATARLREQLLAAATFTSNWYQAGAGVSYFDSADPPLLKHLWSLAVEEQFYLLWPLVLLALMVGVRRARHRLLIVGAGAAASIAAMAWLFEPGTDPSRVYYGTDTHGFGLLIGALAALAVPLLRGGARSPRVRLVQRALRSRAIAPVAALAVLAGIAGLRDDAALAYRGGIAVVCAATALVLISLVLRAGGPVRRVLVHPWLLWLGDRSYAVYLWHWPVLVLARIAAPGAPAVQAAATLYVTLLAAALSWRFVERPVLRHGFRGAARRGVRTVRADLAPRATVALVACTALVLAAGQALREAPQEGEVEQMVLAGERALDRADAAPAETGRTAREAASVPPREPRRPPLAEASSAQIGAQTTVIGDSVTLASAEGLLEAMPGITVSASVGRQMDEAPALLQRLRETRRLRPFVVIALGTNGTFAPARLEEARAAIGEGRRLVLVTAYGDRDWMPDANRRLRAYVERHPDVVLARWDAAAREVDAADFAADGIHPGETGARVFAEVVEDALRRVE